MSRVDVWPVSHIKLEVDCETPLLSIADCVSLALRSQIFPVKRMRFIPGLLEHLKLGGDRLGVKLCADDGGAEALHGVSHGALAVSDDLGTLGSVLDGLLSNNELLFVFDVGVDHVFVILDLLLLHLEEDHALLGRVGRRAHVRLL